MAEGKRFSLHVPLDASGIQDFKPDKAVKVVAFVGKGAAQEAVVRLNADGKGSAHFSFDARPGVVRVVVGPEDATADELKVLQTIGANVSPRAWGASDKLTLSPVVIPARYWWWWLIWCRKFTIRGRVVCADGSAVPGAQVCAYDVDWWWWWTSEDLVGCATTDATGTFEISFRWCCGWWPWWWWARRIWRLEPLLVQRIMPLLQRTPTIPHIPMPDPAPDLAIFDAIRGGGSGRPVPSAPSRAVALQAASSGPRSVTATKRKAIDPAALAALRSQLLAALPASAELAQLRVWPWWPWEPWYDCDPDIIFKVTQHCSGENTVIVDETVWNTRWNIPSTIDVTLVANEEACCIKPCTDPQDCPDGDCLVITDICDDNVGAIGGNPGAPANPAGYLNPGTGDRPFARDVPIFGIFGAAATADYYAFEYSGDGGATWSPVPPASMGGFSCPFWGPGLPAGPVGWHIANFTPTMIDSHLVIESRAHFESSNDPASWGVTRFWDSSCEHLLMNWHTDGLISDGTYRLRVRSWSLVGGHLQNETVLPLCDTTDENGVVVTLDNQVVTGPPTNLDGYPCGPGSVHQCTIEPDTAFVAVRINGVKAGACANVDASKGGTLEIDFVAYDPDSHLAYYTLQALYGDSQVVDLLSAPGATLSAGPATGPVPSCGPLWGPNYGTALGQGAVSPKWQGGVITLTIPNLRDAFPETCCYTLQLFAHKRTIVSCDDSFWGQYNQSDFSLTVVV
jgi:hypothetical protein